MGLGEKSKFTFQNHVLCLVSNLFVYLIGQIFQMACVLLYVYDIFSYCCFKIIEVVWADLKVHEDHGKSDP
jgi:hypothetical protein